MRAAVTEAGRSMRVVDVPEPGDAGRRARCSSGPRRSVFAARTSTTSSVTSGRLTTRALSPRPGARGRRDQSRRSGRTAQRTSRPGERVAIWPLASCGHCYPCRIGRENACVEHQPRSASTATARSRSGLRFPPRRSFRSAISDPALRRAHRARLDRRARGRPWPGRSGREGRRLRRRADRAGGRRRRDRPRGVRAARRSRREPPRARTGDRRRDAAPADGGRDPVAAAREWAGGDGPEVVFEATGVARGRPDRRRARRPGRARGHRRASAHDARSAIGDLAFKEIDVLGVSCCSADEFAEAVSLVARRQDALRGLVTHEFPLEETPAAIEYAMRSSCRGHEGRDPAGGRRWRSGRSTRARRGHGGVSAS